MKLIILDRDGVINHDSSHYIRNPSEWHPIDGSIEAIARLNRAGWRVVMASNQSGLARGLFTMDALNAIHQHMRLRLAERGAHLDALFYCPHGPDDDCNCRKPGIGLFEDIARRFSVDLHQVPAVGDSLRDLQAAAQAGCTPWLVKTGNGASTLQYPQLPAGTCVADDLAAVVDQLLSAGASMSLKTPAAAPDSA